MSAELAKALVAAQSEFPAIEKNATAKVQMKSGGSYTFDYADLPTVLAAVKPILSKHGLTMIHVVCTSNGKPALRSTLMHSSGERIDAEVAIPFDGSRIQELGSAITYMRRYQTLAMLDLCAGDEDDDGNAADKNKANIERRNRTRNDNDEPQQTDDLPDGADKVTSCESLKTKDGKRTYWRILSARGLKLTTFDPQTAQLAAEYMANSALCVLSHEPSKFEGWLTLRDVAMFATPKPKPTTETKPKTGKVDLKTGCVMISRVVPELMGDIQLFHGMVDGWELPLTTTETELAEAMKDASEGGYECNVTWCMTPKGGQRLCKIERAKEAA